LKKRFRRWLSNPSTRRSFRSHYLEAFGNKPTTIKRLRSGASNKSDLGGILQTSNIHIAVCPPGEVTKTLAALKASPATAKAKARFVLATDGEFLEAEDLTTDDAPIACTRLLNSNLTIADQAVSNVGFGFLL